MPPSPRHARPLSAVRYNPEMLKRLRRAILNTVTALSLLLILATAGLWVRSDSRDEALAWRRGKGQQCLSSCLGRVMFSSTSDWLDDRPNSMLVGYRALPIAPFERLP